MAESISVEIRGYTELMTRLAQIGPRAMNLASKALYEEALEIKKIAFYRCPRDTGNLRDSLHVSQPVTSGGEMSVTIFSDSSAPYAIYVHENLNPDVHWTMQGTGPKFLENPINEAIPTLCDNIRKRIDLRLAVG